MAEEGEGGGGVGVVAVLVVFVILIFALVFVFRGQLFGGRQDINVNVDVQTPSK